MTWSLLSRTDSLTEGNDTRMDNVDTAWSVTGGTGSGLLDVRHRSSRPLEPMEASWRRGGKL